MMPADKMPPQQILPFLNKLLKSRDLQEILNLGRPIFGNPMILVDMAFSVLAITDEPELEAPNWKQIRNMRGIPVNAIYGTTLNNVRRKSLETGLPIMDSSADEGVPMLRKTLAQGNRILGYLDAPMYFGEPTEDNIAFFDLLGNLLAVQLQKEVDVADVPDSMLNFFIFDLLEGKLGSTDLINERLRHFKWNVMGKGKVQVVSVRRKIGEPELSDNKIAEIINRVTAISPYNKVISYGSEIKIICSVSASIEMNKQFLDSLKEIFDSENLVAGISRPLPDIENIADCNRQAKKAAELGMVLFPKRCLHFYDIYAIYHTLEISAKDNNPIHFCHSAVIQLWEYDREHDTDLLESLRVYLINNMSVGKSASALFIHRNTMNYRLSKILELTNVDLSDPDVLSNLLFSYYALNFRQIWPKTAK